MTDEEKKELLKQINFESGVIGPCRMGDAASGISVAYKGNFYLDLWWWKNSRYQNCYVCRGKTKIVAGRYAQLDEKFLRFVRHCVREIEDGKYRNKKSAREVTTETVESRGLTSCMNNTKWREFRNAMEHEMPFPPPYIYKTIFEEETGAYFDFSEDVRQLGAYDAESFAGFDFRSIEWVKVRPRYIEYEGGLLAGRNLLHDATEEFIALMEKYSIPYEEKDGAYMVYGYRQNA